MFEQIYRWAAELAQSGWLPSIMAHPFMVRATLAALILAPVMGAFSPLVVTKRLAFFSSALGHAALTGLAIGILMGEKIDQAYGGIFGFSLLLALAITYVRNRSELPSDTVIGVFLAFTLGLGICLLVSVTQRFNIHQVEAVLFGSVLTVTETDLLILTAAGAISTMVLLPIYNQLILGSFNPALARARGVRVTLHEYIFMLTLSVVIVAGIKIIGALLVEALVIAPAASARNLARSIRGYFCWSVLLAMLGTQGGLLIGSLFPVPSGAAIVLSLGLIFIASLTWKISTERWSLLRNRATVSARDGN